RNVALALANATIRTRTRVYGPPRASCFASRSWNMLTQQRGPGDSNSEGALRLALRPAASRACRPKIDPPFPIEAAMDVEGEDASVARCSSASRLATLQPLPRPRSRGLAALVASNTRLDATKMKRHSMRQGMVWLHGPAVAARASPPGHRGDQRFRATSAP